MGLTRHCQQYLQLAIFSRKHKYIVIIVTFLRQVGNGDELKVRLVLTYEPADVADRDIGS